MSKDEKYTIHEVRTRTGDPLIDPSVWLEDTRMLNLLSQEDEDEIFIWENIIDKWKAMRDNGERQLLDDEEVALFVAMIDRAQDVTYEQWEHYRKEEEFERLLVEEADKEIRQRERLEQIVDLWMEQYYEERCRYDPFTAEGDTLSCVMQGMLQVEAEELVRISRN